MLNPAQVRAKFAELRALCLSVTPLTYADRFEHFRLVARQRARDEAKRQGSPQMMLGGCVMEHDSDFAREAKFRDLLEFSLECGLNATPKYHRESIRCLELALEMLGGRANGG